MGSHSQAIQILGQFPIPVSHNYCRVFVFVRDNFAHNKTRCWRCFSGGRSGGSRWDWKKNVNPRQKSRFSDAYATEGYDEEAEFGFRNAPKQRIWWYDDIYEEDDDEEDDGFGILEAAVGFNWVSKIFQAFGWMVPAVVIYLLLGTGPNTIVMALALPLAQSALSLVADTLWGRSNESPRPKSKSKNRPSAGASGRTRVRKEKENRTERGKEAGNYKTWVDTNNVSAKNGKSKPINFGGWDELDNHVRVDKEPRVGNKDEPKVQEGFKISRRTKGDTPLLPRLLIAMFPFLGFWTKLF